MKKSEAPRSVWQHGLHACAQLRLPGAQQIAYSEGTEQFAIWTLGGKLFLRHARTGAGPPALTFGAPLDALFFADAGQTLVAWRRDQPAQRWRLGTSANEPVSLGTQRIPPAAELDDDAWHALEVQEDALHLALDPSGETVISGSRSGELSILPRQAEEGWRATVQASQTHIIDVCFSDEGGRVASCDLDGSIQLWEPASASDSTAREDSALNNTPQEFMHLVEQMRNEATAQLPGLASEIATSSMKGPVLLRALLLDPSPRLRYRTLWLIGVDEIWGFSHELVEALHDPNPTVRLAALGAIDALDDTACTLAVQELLERESQSEVMDQAQAILERFLG